MIAGVFFVDMQHYKFGAVCTQTLRSFTPVLDHTTLERPIIYNKRNLHARVSSVYLY